METLEKPGAPSSAVRRVKNRRYVDDATIALRRGGFRRTLQSDYVLSVLADATEPLGALDILRNLQRDYGQCVHVTNVYQILGRLVSSRAVLIISSLSPSGKGTAYLRRDDCGQTNPGIPFVSVDLCFKQAQVLTPHPELVAEIRRFIKDNHLPDSDFSVQIVAGNSIVEGSSN